VISLLFFAKGHRNFMKSQVYHYNSSTENKIKIRVSELEVLKIKFQNQKNQLKISLN
jgi:hypothetical protein